MIWRCLYSRPGGSFPCARPTWYRSASERLVKSEQGQEWLALSSPLRFVSKPARNSDTAVFWIPVFAGMTSCPPFDGVYPELVEGLRTGSGGHPGFAQSGKPATGRVQAASELCAVFS